MCCLLCLQWAFSLNNFAGIDLVKLIPHTVYLVPGPLDAGMAGEPGSMAPLEYVGTEV